MEKNTEDIFSFLKVQHIIVIYSYRIVHITVSYSYLTIT